MIQHPGFAVDPWTVRETALDLDTLAQTESLFALANGHLGLRANLDEGEPSGPPGTYLAGFYEARPLPYAEPGYGDPEDGQTVVNVTNGKIIRLSVEDEPFDVRYGELRKHERILDLRAGVLRRTVEWASPTGRLVRIASTRIVSFTQRSIAAIHYEVEPIDDAAQVVVQTELVTNESQPTTEKDPRAAAALTAPLASDLFYGLDLHALLVHTTKASKLTVGAAMDHVIDAPDGMTGKIGVREDLARLVVTATPAPGKPLRMTKFLAYSWSGERTVSAVRDQVTAALVGAVQTGWDGLLTEQRALLDEFWDAADIEIEGDMELQQAVRFALFHTLQAGERGEQRPIPAKGLTGPGYDGHTFWDTEAFVLPLLTYSRPRAVADALRWRHSTLDLARERARSLGLRGAAFPWRTIHGEECSGYWPAGTAAFHINAAVANAVERYRRISGDEAFEREAGVELLVETARVWKSLGHPDAAGKFRIDGVTGPD
ncbi:MAG: glycoside hydrolase family 65 protein, partial [Solirubrobacteraceae bacterium]